jgi:RimJ/RimL family protein N-acetyltransferase
LTSDAERVREFCSAQLGDAEWGPSTGIGLERNGVLIAGVLYDRYTGPNVYAHIAAVPGSRWMNRTFLHAIFHYPFIQMGVRRVTGEVEATNERALRLDAHFGFKREAVLKDAMPTGDLILLVLWKEDCRWLCS